MAHPRSAWTPRNGYLYLVCLITLIMALFAIIGAVVSVTELVYPEPQLETVVAKPVAPTGEEMAPADADELARQQEVQRQWSLRRSVISLVRNGAMLLLAVPIYWYHWRKIERAVDGTENS